MLEKWRRVFGLRCQMFTVHPWNIIRPKQNCTRLYAGMCCRSQSRTVEKATYQAGTQVDACTYIFYTAFAVDY